jgi:hypothetical protein
MTTNFLIVVLLPMLIVFVTEDRDFDFLKKLTFPLLKVVNIAEFKKLIKP